MEFLPVYENKMAEVRILVIFQDMPAYVQPYQSKALSETFPLMGLNRSTLKNYVWLPVSLPKQVRIPLNRCFDFTL